MSETLAVESNIQPTPEAIVPEVQAETPAEETKETPTLIDEAVEGSDKKVDAETKNVVPEKYDVKVPEGMTLDTATLDIFTPIFKELGLSQDGAQKLVDAYAPLVSQTSESVRKESLDSYQKIIDGWKTDTIKELGANSKAELAYCGKAIQKFGDKELREVLNETGLGNHKALVKFMAKIGKTISEDSFVGGDSSAKADPLKAMYPSMQQ